MNTTEKTEPLKTENHKNKEADLKYKQYLSFHSGNEIYGIPVVIAKEVIAFDRVYPIPKTPEYIRGVTNLRGDVIPVIDLSSLFYNRISEITLSTSIVLIELKDKGETVLLGLIIDDVEAVIDLMYEDISMVPEFSAKIDPAYIIGVGRSDGKFIIILNLDVLIDLNKLSRF